MKIAYKVFPKDRYGSPGYSALLNVHISLPTPNAPRTKRFEAVIDSGATRCMFHADIGRHIGLDIQKGDQEKTQGIGGSEDTWIHPVRLYVPGGPIDIYAAFKEGLPVAGLLGMTGFFDHFTVMFIYPALACEIHRIAEDQA